jgi:hypothetical protein
VPLLGQFRVRQVDVVKDGQTVKARRVLFVEARVREAAEEGVATTVQAA